MEHMIWPILLLLLGLVFFGLELFIPSSGVLGILAGGSVLASIYVGFMEGPLYGTLSLTMALILVPVAIGLFIRYWPKTPIGRLIFLQPATSEDEVLPLDEEYHQRQMLIGKYGSAKSKMLPSGAVMVDGQIYDAISRGHPIEPGETIRVIAVQSNHIVVAPADPQQVAQFKAASDALSQPLESLGIEPFDEPLA